MVKHFINQSWSGSNGTGIPSQLALSANAEVNVSEQITATTVDQLVNFASPLHNHGVSFWIQSDQAVQMNVNAIHSGAPILTINLAAGVPYLWTNQSGIANPFSADVTALYFSNAGGSAANLEIRSLNN